ncbi:Hypothetical protein SRAE_0000064200 [Strongyloides ratti]|uniref:Uncharacterized protein n=1 Tax=Strongyloides ratti TaxID=34506 RepID=A0A090KVH7_STRRB|nr:Hypothetical protein SRAE_0000064200 [Strongyloides ratti]CEF61520.1 Hypothetical protein SRAE_0000064200 [Strongyloides ratti]
MSRNTSAAMENRMNTEDSRKGTGSSWRTMEKFDARKYADLVTVTSILKNEELLKHQINMIHEQLKNQEELWIKLYYQKKYESLIELAMDLETS